MFFRGYKINKMSIRKAEKVLTEAKQKAHEIAVKRYNELLSREIETLVDNITLNAVPKPEGSIYDAAMDSLDRKISLAAVRRDNTEYNMSAHVNVLTHGQDTYIELCAVSELYDGLFPSLDGVTDCSVSEEEFALPTELAQMWLEVIEKYKHSSVLTMKLFPVYDVPKPGFDKLHFDPPEVRAERLARHHVTNVLLAAYAGGEQIPPYKIMEYMDYALLRASDSALLPVYKEKVKELKLYLIDIKEENIF